MLICACVGIWSISTNAAFAGPEDHIDVPPPAMSSVGTYSHEGYNVHIYVNPDSSATDDNRSVLLLGTLSGPAEVADDANVINPRTGKPYDVIIGLASDSSIGEFARVVLDDHFSADANTNALREAIQDRFGGALHAASLDTHSNGNTLGVTAMLAQGDAAPFVGVKEMHAMGPDIGYGGHYFNADNIAKIHDLGVEIHVYLNKGDFVPTLGYASRELVRAVHDNTVDPQSAFHDAAQRATEALLSQQQIQAQAQKFPDVVHVDEFDSIGPNFVMKDGKLHVANHEVRTYLSLRQGQIPDLAAEPEMDPDLLLDQQWMENAIHDGREDVLAKGLENLASKLTVAEIKMQRRIAIERLIAALKLKQAAAQHARDVRMAQIAAAQQRAAQWQAMQQTLATRQNMQSEWAQAGGPPQPPPPEEVADETDDNEPGSEVSSSDDRDDREGNTDNGGNRGAWNGSSTFNQLESGNLGW